MIGERMKGVFKLVIIFSLGLLGCGGGGSGGGDSNGSASTGVRVLNASIDLPPVSLTTTAKVGQTISTTKFAQATGFFELPDGEQTISVQTVDGGTGPFNFSVSIENRDRPQILIYGTREFSGISATLIEARKIEIRDGFAAVRVVNGVSGVRKIEGSIGTVEIPDLVTFGDASKYLFVTAGPTLIKLLRSADSRILVNQQVSLESGKAYSMVVNGEVDYLVVSNLLED